MTFKLPLLLAATCGLAVFAAAPAAATGRMTCNAGPQSSWKTQDELVQTLTRQGWQVRRTKIDAAATRSTAPPRRATASRPISTR